MEEPEYIQPLPVILPPRLKKLPFSIERIWYQYNYEEKMLVIHSVLELSFEFEKFVNLPREFIVLTSVLNSLINGINSRVMLTPVDVAVFIIQALAMRNAEEIEGLLVPFVDATAVYLSTLFMRGVTTLLMVINICGNPFPISFAMPWHFFDGKSFHYFLNKARIEPYISDLCFQSTEIINKFYWLLSIVTTNTSYSANRFNWTRVFNDFDVSHVY